jgi:hypothetical protein
VASSKRVRAGSSRMGVAHHGQRPIFGSMLGLGRTSGYLIGMRCPSPWKALERCNDTRRSSGRADRYAFVAATQRFPFKPPRITPLSGTVRDLASTRAAIAGCRRIVVDADEQLGQPIVSNGLPLTKIHHAARPPGTPRRRIKKRSFKMKSMVDQSIL